MAISVLKPRIPRVSHSPGSLGVSFSQGPGDRILGLGHPGVDQARLRSDPYYAEAATRANEAHIAAYGVPWVDPDSPAAAVSSSIQSSLKALEAEGWKPPGEEEPAPMPSEQGRQMAERKSVAKQRKRRGRLSTVLSDGDEGEGLGG